MCARESEREKLIDNQKVTESLGFRVRERLCQELFVLKGELVPGVIESKHCPLPLCKR